MINAEITKYMLISREQNAGQITTCHQAVSPPQALQSSNILEQH